MQQNNKVMTRKELRKVISEAINYAYTDTDSSDLRQTGILIQLDYYDNNHPLYVGNIDFSYYGAEYLDELNDQQYYKIMSEVMAIIEHPASRLNELQRDNAEQELIGVLQGDTKYTGTYFYPIFEEEYDIIDREPAPDMFGPGGRYDPDIDSHGYGRDL